MKEHKHKNYPLQACIEQAKRVIEAGNAVVLQKFTCSNCGERQTMDNPNVFYTHGTCEECGSLTDIQETGCNYLLHKSKDSSFLEQFYGDYSPKLTLVDCNEYVAENPVRKQ